MMARFTIFIVSVLAGSIFAAAHPAPEPQASSGAGCTPLSSTDAQTIAGWQTVVKTAVGNWGSGAYNIVANDPAYPDQAAQNCDGIAKGWIWFEYLATTDGHYKWALDMDSVLPNNADRKIGVNPPPAPTSAPAAAATPPV